MEMLTPLCVFDTFWKTVLPTHFLLVMLRFHVASNGKHCRRSKSTKAAEVATMKPIIT